MLSKLQAFSGFSVFHLWFSVPSVVNPPFVPVAST